MDTAAGGTDIEGVTAAAYTPVKGDEDCYMQGLSDTPTAPIPRGPRWRCRSTKLKPKVKCTYR